MNEFTDDSLMPFGKYKGQKMANVPAQYLMFIYDQDWCRGKVKQYIDDNLEVLKLQANYDVL